MTFGQNNQYFTESNTHSEYDNPMPFTSFKMDYTKRNIMSALKARRHIIYTLSPILTIIVLLIYIFAMYTYFSRMEYIISDMIIGKFFTVVWCTIISLMVATVVVFFVTFEIIRFKKAKEILRQMPQQTEIKIYANRLEYIDDSQEIISVQYSEIASVKETEEYYFVTCKNKQMIILDKGKANGYYSYLTSIAVKYSIYSQSLISSNGYLEKLPPKRLVKIKNQSIRLIPLCIASIYLIIMPASLCLSIISSTAGNLKFLLKITSLILALLSNVFPVYSIIFGAKYKIRNLKTVKNIVIGCITLFYSAIFSLAICLGSITL